MFFQPLFVEKQSIHDFRNLFNYFILSLSISDLISAILSPCVLYRRGWGFDFWAAPAFLCKVALALSIPLLPNGTLLLE